MVKNKKGRALRAFCGALAVLSLVLCLGTPPVRAEESPGEKVDRLQQELEKQKEELEKIQKDKKNAQARKTALQNQRNILQQQVEALVQAITEAETAITVKTQEVADQQAAIDTRWDSFQQQVCAMQIMHDGGAVALLSSAQSLYELLTFSDTLQQMSEKQNQVLEDMRVQKADLEAKKADLEAQKANLDEAKATLDTKVAELSSGIQQLDTTIGKAAADEEAQKIQVEATQAQFEQAEKEYEEWIKQHGSSGGGTISEAGWLWPLPGYGYNAITTYFGATQNINGYIKPGHGGLDLAAPEGTPIYASISGTVSTNAHWTYGTCALVDNGNGVLTIYGHMSSRVVNEGDYVKQGDLIGYVGHTGRSTGNHLHFEVRINGVKKDPLNYIQY